MIWKEEIWKTRSLTRISIYKCSIPLRKKSQLANENHKKSFKDKCSANKCASKICGFRQSMAILSTFLDSQNSTGVINFYLIMLASQGNRGTLQSMPPDNCEEQEPQQHNSFSFFIFMSCVWCTALRLKLTTTHRKWCVIWVLISGLCMENAACRSQAGAIPK